MARTSQTYIAGSFLALVAARGAGPETSEPRVTTEVQCHFEGTGLAARIESTRLLSPPEGMQARYFVSACFLPGGKQLAEGSRGELHCFGPSGAWEFRFEAPPGEKAPIPVPGCIVAWPKGCVSRALDPMPVEGRVTYAVLSASDGKYLRETSFGGLRVWPLESRQACWVVRDYDASIEDESGNELVRIATRPDGAAFRQIFSPSFGEDGAWIAVDAPLQRAPLCMQRVDEPPPMSPDRGVVLFEFSARGEALGQWRLPPEAEIPLYVIPMPRRLAIVWDDSKGSRLALLDRTTGAVRDVSLPEEVARMRPLGLRAHAFGDGLEWIGGRGSRSCHTFELVLPGS